MASRRKFTPKYRVEAANLVIATDRTAAEVSREIGVGEQLLGRWSDSSASARLRNPKGR